MEEKEKFEKITFLLRQIYNERQSKWLGEFLNYSKFEYEKHWNHSVHNYAFNLYVLVDPEVYIKNFSSMNDITSIIKGDIHKISILLIDKIKIIPDYASMQISNTEIVPVYTVWEEINRGQAKLVELLKRSSDSFDFQNIGNTSRTILQKLANQVFDPKKHIPSDSKIDVTSGKYKNQLHTYIKTELSGDTDTELRKFAVSAIENVEDAIDLANATTHKLQAERVFAEACIISVISAISIVKLVESKR